MLRLTLRLIASLILTALLLVSASRLYGYAQPVPDVLLTVDSLICYVQACSNPPAHSLEVDTLIERIARDASVTHFNRYVVRYYRSSRDGQPVVYIQATTETGLLSLGDMLLHSGKPCVLIFTDDATYLQYPTFFASVAAVYIPGRAATLNLTLSPFTPVENIFIYSQPLPCATPLTFPTTFNIFSTWRGFAKLKVYVSRDAN